jgi:hypothetical protein
LQFGCRHGEQAVGSRGAWAAETEKNSASSANGGKIKRHRQPQSHLQDLLMHYECTGDYYDGHPYLLAHFWSKFRSIVVWAGGTLSTSL